MPAALGSARRPTILPGFLRALEGNIALRALALLIDGFAAYDSAGAVLACARLLRRLAGPRACAPCARGAFSAELTLIVRCHLDRPRRSPIRRRPSPHDPAAAGPAPRWAQGLACLSRGPSDPRRSRGAPPRARLAASAVHAAASAATVAAVAAAEGDAPR